MKTFILILLIIPFNAFTQKNNIQIDPSSYYRNGVSKLNKSTNYSLRKSELVVASHDFFKR